MSDVTLTLNVSRTETYTVETTEADIRAACDKHGLLQAGLGLHTLLGTIGGTYTAELVIATLTGDAQSDSEEWSLDEWTADEADDEE
jgi:hypothetical protein